MSHSHKAITIHDVAEAAGVSVSTVSRVLNEKADVAPATYQRVRDVIARLGYTSSLAARSMRSRRTGVIGLIIPNLEDPYCLQVLKGVNHAAFELQYDLIIYTSAGINGRPRGDRDQHYVSLLNGSLTDGVIVVTPFTSGFLTTAPVVAIDPNTASPSYPTVIAANYAGTLTAMDYLTDLGHQRIGFIAGRPDLQAARQRLEGYHAAMSLAQLAADPDLVAVGDFTIESGRACARHLLALAQPPTAIFAANDQSAIGAIEAAHELGFRVPEDLSVIGFDNTPEAANCTPALTTVDQFIARMGHEATAMLIRLVQGVPVQSVRYEMPTQLVVRDSCRSLRSDRVQADAEPVSVERR